MGHAAEAWDKLSSMITEANFDGITDVYGVDAVFLEPYNPPHRGNLLIQAYLKDYFHGKSNIEVKELKRLESEDGTTVAVEWTLSYDAAGRRWTDLPRGSFLQLDADGLVEYHRDYS